MKRCTRPCSIGEAFLWTFGYHLAQGLVLLLFLATLFLCTFGLHLPTVEQLTEFVLHQNLDSSFELIGVASLGAVLVLLPMVRWRLGRRFRQVIGWRTPRHEEVIFALATVLPIAILGGSLYEWSRSLQVTLTGQVDQGAGALQTSLDLLHASLQGVPYPILVVALALGPAIGEELIFRGIIGRGLVERCGFWRGSLLTACLFAISHGSLSHAIATLPIALLLQFLYLKTGTIFVPILVHFCNNLLSVSLIRFSIPVDLAPTLAICLGFAVYLLIILVVFEARRRDWTPVSYPSP